MTTEEPLSAKGAARQLGTTARNLRKFLRSDDTSFDAVGQGRRYEFDSQQFKKLKKEFEKWNNRNAPIEVEPSEPDEDIEELELEE